MIDEDLNVEENPRPKYIKDILLEVIEKENQKIQEGR